MKLYVIINIILCFSGITFGQNFTETVSINLGSRSLRINEPFVISVVLEDVETRPGIIFPEIKGLEKRSKSAVSAVNTVNGRKILVQTISQEYSANKIGRYQIPDLYITVNGTKYKVDQTVVEFINETDTQPNVSVNTDINNLPEPELGEQGVFLSVQSDRKSVYIREGFTLRISLYIAESAPIKMEFYQFNTQLQAILKKIRPANCWEENVGIEEIIKKQVNIKGNRYTEYMMYQAQFFPLTLQDVIFPLVSLEMLAVENKNAVNVENKVIRSFKSKEVNIQVRPLPDHPLRDQVSVGRYSLVENLSSNLVYPGESVRYIFKVTGQGNIAAIPAPQIELNSAFDIYPPDISPVMKRNSGIVSGEKAFDYFVVPRKDGNFPLGRYFQWIYFNPSTSKYDTLRSMKTLQVKGEDYKLGNISLSGSTGLYDNLESLNTTLQKSNYKNFFKDVTNIIVIILLIAMFWVLRN